MKALACSIEPEAKQAMKQKLHPGVAILILLAVVGVILAVMYRASEAPKWNRLPPPMKMGPPGIPAAATAHQKAAAPGAHKGAKAEGTSGQGK